MSSIHSLPHSLYRFYGAGDVLLYVGLTANLPVRLTHHQDHKPWWSEVERMTVQRYSTREAVAEAERVAIRDEAPLYNVQHNRGTRSPRPVNKETDVMTSSTLVGSFFHGDGARPWQGYVVEELVDGHFFVATYSWLSGCEWTRHIVHLSDMASWTFYASDEQMREHSERMELKWKRDREGDAPSTPLDFSKFLGDDRLSDIPGDEPGV